MSSEQFDLLVEVKCAPKSMSISLSERDLAGIRVDSNSSDIGALAVLNDHSSYRCSMVFIEIQDIPQSMIGTTAKSELPLGSDSATLAYISSRWEDWILRSGAIENVFEKSVFLPCNIPIFDTFSVRVGHFGGGSIFITCYDFESISFGALSKAFFDRLGTFF